MRTELSYDNAMFWATQQYDLLKQQASLEVKITALEYEIDRLEKDVLMAVTSEREDGKPRFGNEQARKAEMAHRLSLRPEYQRTQAEVNILNKESLYLQREAKYAGKIVEIMCTFARKEDEPLIPVPASVLASMGRPDMAKRTAGGIFPEIEGFAGDNDEESPAA